MPSLSRQQVIAWSAVILVVLLIGANYLRGQITSRTPENASVMTVGLTQERPAAGIKVHVTGAVAGPGLYEFKSGDRVADALAKAGGATAEADISQINLAAKLTDGQQVAVPAKGQAPVAGETEAAVSPGGAAATSGGSGSPGTPAQPIDLNNATAAQLEGLDGIGPKTAQKIIAYREANGGFKSVEQLMEVPGIGPAKFDQIKGQVFV